MFSPRNSDSELENLREEIDGPPNLDTVLLSIQRLSSQVHASYLFEREGKPILQKLCLLLSSTATGKKYADWQDFAAYLGLLEEQIRCIDFDFKGLEDPTYYVLLAYVQSPKATLGEILTALTKVKRLDIINRIKDCTNDLIGNVFLNRSADDNMEILRPKCIPSAPLVLRSVTHIGVTSDGFMNNSHQNVYSVQNKDAIKNACCTYRSIVMLSFANDGIECANNIKKIFRSMVPRVGVLILNEQKKNAYCRGVDFVDDCFKQVNYVIPILTKDYIRQINSSVNLYNQENYILDVKYLKYMYSLVKFEYIKQNCCNKRVRCIVPDEEIQYIMDSDIHPTLQVWFKESDIELFAEHILPKKLE